ncbi:MAG: hypothetical protein AAF191_02590 [Verrucomicrobiota bacterium]
MLRLVQVMIGCAWLLSTGFLIRRSYFPDLGGTTKIPVEDVSKIYFEKGQTAELLFLTDQGAVGRLTVTPRSMSKRLRESGLPSETGELFITGRLNPVFLGEHAALIGDVIWNGSLFVDPEFRIRGQRLNLRLSELDVSLQLASGSKTEEVAFRVSQKGKTIADSSSMESMEGTLIQVQTMAQLAGISFPDLLAQAKEAEADFDFPEPTGRLGRFQIQGRRYEGYLLDISFHEEFRLRFILSELGELLRIEGIPSLDLLGEAFVPEEMMEYAEEAADEEEEEAP